MGQKGSQLLSPQTGKLLCEPWHIPPRYFCKNPYAGYKNFAVVRDPYSRIISEFRCPWKGFHAIKAATSPVERQKRKALRMKASAKDLNAWVLEQLEYQRRARPPFRKGHLIPQHMYIFNSEGERFVPAANVLRFERLSLDFAALRARYKLPDTSLEQINESEMKRFSPSDLSASSRRLIEEEYSEDFQKFGYEFLS